MLRKVIALFALLPCVLAPAVSNSLGTFQMYTKAPQVIVFELESGTVLLERGADIPTVPSSMSKLMTLYIVFQHLKAGTIKLDDKLVVSASAWKRGGSSAFLRQNQMVKVSDLIQGAAVSSGNDACITLAEGILGSQEQFVKEMNSVAAQMQLTHSHFTNVTGWPDDGHVMSPRDILTLSIRIFTDFPEYYHWFSQKQFTYNGVSQKNYNTLLNHNIGVDGIKTGHTTKAGYGMVASAQKGGRRVFVVVNGLKTDAERMYETKRLMLYAFNRFDTKLIFHKNAEVGKVKVRDGTKTKIPIYVDRDVVVTYPRGMDKEVKVSLVHKGALAAPVHKGQNVGTLRIRIPGVKEQNLPVRAMQDVQKLTKIEKIMHMIGSYLFG